MTVHSLFQPPILLAVALVALVIGTYSESGMTEVEEDRFVCLACQARHFPAIFVPGVPCASTFTRARIRSVRRNGAK